MSSLVARGDFDLASDICQLLRGIVRIRFPIHEEPFLLEAAGVPP